MFTCELQYRKSILHLFIERMQHLQQKLPDPPSPPASLFPGASVCTQCAAGWYSNVSGAYLSGVQTSLEYLANQTQLGFNARYTHTAAHWGLARRRHDSISHRLVGFMCDVTRRHPCIDRLPTNDFLPCRFLSKLACVSESDIQSCVFRLRCRNEISERTCADACAQDELVRPAGRK
jgi:hypothetical protein